MTRFYARQGDLVIARIDSIPRDGLRPARDLVLAGDSSGRPHVIRGSMLAIVEPTRTRTLVQLAESTVLEHQAPGGHQKIPLPAGDYEIRTLRERGSASDREVRD